MSDDKVRARLEKSYGLEPGEYEAMERAQDGVCAICGRPPKKVRLNIDHHHLCAQIKAHRRASVRGLLCVRCNRGHYNEDPALMRLAATYFERHLRICPGPRLRPKRTPTPK